MLRRRAQPRPDDELRETPFTMFGISVIGIWVSFGREPKITVLAQDDSAEARWQFSRWAAKRPMQIEVLHPRD
ncbi:MAG TPA: hypothetical protein VEP50_01855 [bacterium]|nr:hypothetical protein [bacterium]